MMGHGGALSHADTVANLSLFAREVLPRLSELQAAEYELGEPISESSMSRTIRVQSATAS